VVLLLKSDLAMFANTISVTKSIGHFGKAEILSVLLIRIGKVVRQLSFANTVAKSTKLTLIN